MIRVVFVLTVWLVASIASAQTVVSPQSLLFTASTDHNAVVTGTTNPVVTNYAVSVYQGTLLTMSQVLGKPTPDGSNTISISLASISGWNSLAKNVTYTVKVSAVGPAGSAESGPSNPFVLAPVPAAPGNVRVQ